MANKNNSLMYNGDDVYELCTSIFKEEVYLLLNQIFDKKYPLIKNTKINKKSNIVYISNNKKDDGEIL